MLPETSTAVQKAKPGTSTSVQKAKPGTSTAAQGLSQKEILLDRRQAHKQASISNPAAQDLKRFQPIRMLHSIIRSQNQSRKS